MADSINIGNITVDKFYLGSSDNVQIYLGTTKLYPNTPTPTGSTCYEIISAPITSYTSTTYDSVYSFSDGKWYLKNNLNNMEEYGVYDIVDDIATATTYDGKLAVVGETEYQFNNGSWEEVGTYVDSSVTYTIDNTKPSPYVGQTLSTTFKIPVADIEANPSFNFIIVPSDGGGLRITTSQYNYYDKNYRFENGTITSDSKYYYYSLPTTQSIVVGDVGYWDLTPIHLIVGSKQVSVEYSAKTAPSSALTYSTIEEMEAAQCPDVGVGQYCYTDGQVYRFDATEAWVTAQDSELFVTQFYDDNSVGVLGCGFNDNILTLNIVQNHPTTIPSVEPTLALVIGDCVTSIGNNACYGMIFMSACTIGSGVTSIGASAFRNCRSLTSIEIPSSVTSIASWAFAGCTSLTSVIIPNSVTSFDARIFDGCTSLTSVILGDNVTQIGAYMFNGCTKLSSVTFNTVTPPPMPYSNTFEGCSCNIYVPSESLNAYKSASGWSNYASRIQAIPNS